MTRKKAKRGTVPAEPPKSARASPPSPLDRDEGPLFCFKYADVGATGDVAFRPDADGSHELLSFLHAMAKLTWREIEAQQTGTKNRHRKHHSHEVDRLGTDAQDRVRQRKYGERFGDTMFRFRLGGEKRLWGFRRDRTFHVIWWDPHHAVYPQDK